MNTLKEITLTTKNQQLIQANIAYHFGIIPKGLKDGKLHLFVKDQEGVEVHLKELELILGMAIVLDPVDSSIINKALATYYRSSGKKKVDSEFKLGEDFLEDLIWDAKSIGSSDIHFEVFRNSARIRFRIDGQLIERYHVKKDDYLELVSKIKVKSKLNITEKRLPQDGRINYNDFDIRVSVLPTLHGEKIVMRILGKDTSNLTIDVLGMNEEEKNIYLEAVNATKGIILISGPTGSGKTTTLYATLKLLNKIDTNILTIEDPIEYTMEGINQVQLKEDIGLTFSSALKTFLRQDPDIIMLGEIRDEKTAQMAIRASLTGHLVLSTIHTNSALGTLSRLIDMGVPSFLIAETLRISVAQRLVKKLCVHCKVKTKVVDTNFAFDGLAYHYVATGCDNCYHTGYKGRIAVYEFIPMNEKVIEIIRSGNMYSKDNNAKIEYEKLSQKALKLVIDGVTSIEEVYPILMEDKNNK